MSDNSLHGWTEVPGFPGYAVTTAGRIRGPRGELRPMVTDSGHLYVIARRKKLSVHHAVLLAVVSPRPEGQECRHIDGDPTNNALVNLCWGTRLQNRLDQAIHGRVARGEQKPGARLTAVQVEAIRLDPRSSRAVGSDYGVSHTAIQRIRRGERWAA